MAFGKYWFVATLLILTGCLAPAARPGMEQQPEVQRLALSVVPLGVPVRVGGREFLGKMAVLFSRDGWPVPYREAEIPVRNTEQGLTFVLQPVEGPGPSIRYQVVESRGGSPVTLRFASDAPLPDIAIQATAPAGLIPVRLAEEGRTKIIYSIIGQPGFASCDALYDPERDRAVGIDQPFQYTAIESPRQQGVVGILLSGDGELERRVTFTAHPAVLSTRFKFEPPAGNSRRRPEAVSPGWCVMRQVGGPDAADLERWLRDNMAFNGELVRVPPNAGVPELLCAQAVAEPDAALADESPWPAWKPRLDKARDIHGRVVERGERYNWQHARELIATSIENYWAHGIVGHNVPGPLLIDAPLSLEHARMWVTLMGLSGQRVVIGDDLTRLSPERVELLRAILPPAPVRAMDLFAHELPEQWVLTTTRQWRLVPNPEAPSGSPATQANDETARPGGSMPQNAQPASTESEAVAIEPVLIVGVFNWSLEPRRAALRFDELMPALAVRPDKVEADFAVWDVWERRLLTIAREAFALPMPPASGRLLCIVPAEPSRPVLLSAGRHIAQGQLELSGLRWDQAQSTMSGAVDLPADDPYELRMLVPEGADSFEIEQVHAPGARTDVRQDGPVWRVTLTADEDGRVEWSVKFRSASLSVSPPAAPEGLEAAQNTQGVRLTWDGRDEHATRYRVYRNGKLLAETARPVHQDSTVEFDREYEYAVTAVDYAGRESVRSAPVNHRTPTPADIYLSELVPLVAEQEHLAVMTDTSAAGKPLRVAGKTYQRGLGTHSNARIRYYLGGGYETLTGEVGIDDATEGKGSCVFKVLADGEELFVSRLLRGGDAAQPFSVSVRDRLMLELVVTDGGDHPDYDHADWCDLRLTARVR